MTSIKNYFRLVAEDQEKGFWASILKPILDLVSRIYGAATVLVQGLYQKGILPSKKLPFPVISVGNLTWGGTGKTPLVEYLARRMVEQRKNPLVLTRGYGDDEIKQLLSHLPAVQVGVGKERDEAARKVSQGRHVDAAILDDGFQHWKIKRDVEIVTVNAINPFGNGKLFPRGILREPRQALGRATVVVLTHVNLAPAAELSKLKEEIQKLAPKAVLTEAYLEPLFFYRAGKRNRLSLDRLGNRRVATFSALGNPRSFQLLLKQVGVKPVRNFEFCDHHVFSKQELEEIKDVSVRSGAEEIITTEKDFYRSPETITQVLDPLVLAARLRISSGEESLSRQVFSVLGLN